MQEVGGWVGWCGGGGGSGSSDSDIKYDKMLHTVMVVVARTHSTRHVAVWLTHSHSLDRPRGATPRCKSCGLGDATGRYDPQIRPEMPANGKGVCVTKGGRRRPPDAWQGCVGQK